MSVENQPNTILTEYSPFAWIEDTTGSFVNFPTAQTANISFPDTILCSNLQSFTPSTTMNIGTNMDSTALMNIGNTASWINIYGRLQSGLRLNYIPSTYSGVDNYLGGYKEDNYNPVSPSQSINTTQQRIVGRISGLLSVGVYQLNVHTTLSSSVLNPYLVFQLCTKTAFPDWVNGSLRAGTGTLVPSLLKLNRNPTTAVADLYTLDMSGLLIVSTKAYYAIVVGNADLTVSQNLTSINTYMSVLRVG